MMVYTSTMYDWPIDFYDTHSDTHRRHSPMVGGSSSSIHGSATALAILLFPDSSVPLIDGGCSPTSFVFAVLPVRSVDAWLTQPYYGLYSVSLN